jgi:hypothetical protein
MSIDRSLAKGLKTQFIYSWDTEVKLAFDTFSKVAHKIDLSSRNNFSKYIRAHHEAFKRIAMSYVVAGSKRSPFIGMVVLQPDRRRFSDWIEYAVGGLIDVTSLTESGKQNQDIGRSTFFIAEHAIARVYQRSYDTKKDEVIDPFIIVREFCYIPLWASFWSLLIFHAQENLSVEEIESICPVIPAPNGIFLCKVTSGSSRKSKFIEIRTYVQNEKLTES